MFGSLVWQGGQTTSRSTWFGRVARLLSSQLGLAGWSDYYHVNLVWQGGQTTSRSTWFGRVVRLLSSQLGLTGWSDY